MPKHHEQPRQYFVFGIWQYDITAALDILRRKPREAVPLCVTSWAIAYGLDDNPYSLIRPLGAFDREYAMATDLSVPLIVARFTVPDGTEGAPLLIDGMHRVYRAHAEGVEKLPAFLLSVEESEQIRTNALRG